MVAPGSSCYANLTLVGGQTIATIGGGTHTVAWTQTTPTTYDVTITDTIEPGWITAITGCLSTPGQLLRLDLDSGVFSPLGLSFYADAATAVVNGGTVATFTYDTGIADTAAQACNVGGGLETQVTTTDAFLAGNPVFAQTLTVPAVVQIVTCYRVSFATVLNAQFPAGQDCAENPDDLVAADPNCPAWQVTYWQGRAIPLEAMGVAAILAEQFARAKCGGKCDEGLNPGLKRVARRGSTREYETASTTDDVKVGMQTGLPLVDAWIAAVNPARLRRRSRLIRADHPDGRRLWSWVNTGWTP
jgi:hypothetical protein